MENKLAFGTEAVKLQGKVYRVGDLLVDPRMGFGAHIILGFCFQDSYGDRLLWVRLSRPYAYASCVGTTSPTTLLGAEEYTALLPNMLASCQHLPGSYSTDSLRVLQVEPEVF